MSHLTFDLLTLNICYTSTVTWSKFARSYLSEIEQSQAYTHGLRLYRYYRSLQPDPPWNHQDSSETNTIVVYMSMMTISVFSIAASSWMKFFTTVVNVSNVIPPQTMICLRYRQKTNGNSLCLPELEYSSLTPDAVVCARRLQRSQCSANSRLDLTLGSETGVFFSVAGPKVWSSLPATLRKPNIEFVCSSNDF